MSHKGFRLCPYYTIWEHLCIIVAEKRCGHERNSGMAGSQRFFHDSEYLCLSGHSSKKHFRSKDEQGVQYLSRHTSQPVKIRRNRRELPKQQETPGSLKTEKLSHSKWTVVPKKIQPRNRCATTVFRFCGILLLPCVDTI